jgi:hypothetical protein
MTSNFLSSALLNIARERVILRFQRDWHSEEAVQLFAKYIRSGAADDLHPIHDELDAMLEEMKGADA